MDNKKQAARKELESFRKRSKTLERDVRISKETRDIENKEQTARQELENSRKRSEPLERDLRISKETREVENKEQAALPGFRLSRACIIWIRQGLTFLRSFKLNIFMSVDKPSSIAYGLIRILTPSERKA